MKVLLNLITSDASLDKGLIVDWAFRYFREHKNHECIVIGQQLIAATHLPNIIQIVVKPPVSKAAFGAWKRFKLEPLIRKQQCEVVICWDPVRVDDSVKLILVASAINILRSENSGKEKLQLKQLQKSGEKCSQVIVFSEAEKNWIMEHYPAIRNRISVVYPIPTENIVALEFEEKELYKEKYTGGNEFFIVPACIPVDQLTVLLKGYSGFKKWQKSGMKLLLSYDSEVAAEAIGKVLSNYRFKDSVQLISEHDDDYLKIVSSAYAAILPHQFNNDLRFLFTCMHASVPVLIPESSIYAEILDEQHFTFTFNNKESITSSLLQIFKEETLRSKRIERQNEVIKKFEPYESSNEFFSRFLM